ncbi:WecB/TagA/CpsF family glycosyltransferase [Virgibacillus sp. DJP39]|uniref:WecB/TagA/CpsF family glycosyltransferase n=1 Tax=Virgibacillus sp. DJP39 TaxID=3409790 RepID=UPI003BB4EE91
MKFVHIMGVPFIHIDQLGFVRLLEERIEQMQRTFVITANPEVVMKAKNESDFMTIIKQANFVTADGIGVVKAAQLLGDPLPGRVTGYDTMMALLESANKKKYKIFLLGGKKETLNKAKSTINAQFPNIDIVGSEDGYFNWEENTIAEQIEQLKPDITFVALGVPRQEKWIYENINRFSQGVFIGVGGSLDVLAGTVQRAPVIWQKMNLEWLYRLLRQPSRWRRMLALPIFAGEIIKQKIKGSR